MNNKQQDRAGKAFVIALAICTLAITVVCIVEIASQVQW